jgi:Omp85 superfamily domain
MTQKLNVPISNRNSMSYGARLAVIAFALLLVLTSFHSLFAQQTREELIVQLQAKKAQELHPYVPSKGERIFLRLQSKGFLGGVPEGFFPAFGSVYRTGSFAAGARYFNRFGEGGALGIVGLWSIKNYKLAEMGLTLPSFDNRHIKIDLLAQYLDAPKLPFYGVGQNSDVDNKREYEWQPTTLGVRATITTVPWLYFGGGVDYLDVNTKPGDIPNIFPPATVPGLGIDPTYVRSHVFFAIDYRQTPGYSTSGGYYHADWWDYSQQNTGNFSFQEFDAEAIQLIPILRANWVIGLRGLVSLTNTDSGNVVPFFYLPNLGGGRDLRGYPDFRFMDQNRILWTVEYRWLPSKFLDMVLFYEAGKVTADQSDLDFSNLVNSYGIGARLHGPASTPIRLEYARSKEGSRIIFAFSPAW